jgi:mono/diheme cytochrome c family protein
MVNAGTTVYDLRKFPVDQPERFQHSVTNGKGNMPSFKEALTPEQIASLWAYIGSRGGKEN